MGGQRRRGEIRPAIPPTRPTRPHDHFHRRGSKCGRIGHGKRVFGPIETGNLPTAPLTAATERCDKATLRAALSLLVVEGRPNLRAGRLASEKPELQSNQSDHVQPRHEIRRRTRRPERPEQLFELPEEWSSLQGYGARAPLVGRRSGRRSARQGTKRVYRRSVSPGPNWRARADV